MKAIYKKVRPFLVLVLVVLAFAIGFWQMANELLSGVGDLGMNDVGRQVYCQKWDDEIKGSSTIRIYCEGFFRDKIVVSLKESLPILTGKIKPNEVIAEMKKPYSTALFGIEGLLLRGNRLIKTGEKLVPLGEIIQRLDKLGVQSIADFYAACGFTKFLIRDEKDKRIYLEITFSNKHYGLNPVETK